MNKRIKILIITIVIVVIALAVLAFDLLRVREERKPGVDYTTYSPLKAYSVRDYGSKVILTTYKNGTAMRVVKTMYFSDDKLIEVYEKHYFENKLNALLSLKDMEESYLQVNRVGNMIYCEPTNKFEEVGTSKEDVLKSMEDAYAHLAEKIIE